MTAKFPLAHRIASWSTLSILVVAGAILFPYPATAQVTTPDPLEGLQDSEDSADPFSSTGSGQPQSMLDLIHRANLGGGRSLSEFSLDQQESLGSEASDFRTRQRELFEQPVAVPNSTPLEIN